MVKKKAEISKSTHSINSYFYAIILGLIVITFLCFRPGLDGEFTNWDDDRYVKENVLIQQGSWGEILTEYYMGNYHPLALASYALEYKIWGANPYVYKLTNLILHILNTLLIFLIAQTLTRRNLLASAMAGFLFALHPMHVESVTWISERKDVLYALFFFAAWYAWILYRNANQTKWYLAALLLFVLSCLSKGMAVTFTGVIVLTDLILQKTLRISDIKYYIPFAAVSVFFGVVAIFAQQEAGFIYLETQWSYAEKIALAGYAFLLYLWKMILPFRLAAFYPFPEKIAGNLPAVLWLAPVLVASILWLSWYLRKHSYWFLLGPWFFAITIVIVLQILSVGEAIAADRYFYVSSAGFCIALGMGYAWLYQEGSKKNSMLKPLTGIAGVGIIAGLSLLTYQQTQIWKNSLTLWTDTISKYERVPIAHYNLGVTYGLEQQDYARAEPHFLRAIEIRPGYPQALYNLGIILTNRGDYDKSTERFQQLLRVKADYPLAHSGIGYNLEKQSKFAEAAAMYQKELSISPESYNVWLGLGINLGKSGDLTGSIPALQKAATLDASRPEPFVNMGVFHFNAGRYREALPFYEMALQRKPGHPEAYFNMGSAFMNMSQMDSAEWAFRKALEQNPKLMESYISLGNIASGRGDTKGQIENYKNAAALGHQGAMGWLQQRNISWN